MTCKSPSLPPVLLTCLGLADQISAILYFSFSFLLQRAARHIPISRIISIRPSSFTVYMLSVNFFDTNAANQ
jgi:hypothetical protein